MVALPGVGVETGDRLKLANMRGSVFCYILPLFPQEKRIKDGIVGLDMPFDTDAQRVDRLAVK